MPNRSEGRLPRRPPRRRSRVTAGFCGDLLPCGHERGQAAMVVYQALQRAEDGVLFGGADPGGLVDRDQRPRQRSAAGRRQRHARPRQFQRHVGLQFAAPVIAAGASTPLPAEMPPNVGFQRVELREVLLPPEARPRQPPQRSPEMSDRGEHGTNVSPRRGPHVALYLVDVGVQRDGPVVPDGGRHWASAGCCATSGGRSRNAVRARRTQASATRQPPKPSVTAPTGAPSPARPRSSR